MLSLGLASSPSWQRREALVVGAILLVLFVAPRVLHLGEIIDDPHSWVQADREFSVWAYYRNGPSLLDMHVCYFGGYRTTLLEFPLPDVLPALVYRLFGPHVLISRLMTLLFFAGAAFYLHRLVEYLFDRRLAMLTLAVYLVLPLGLFYSRAILLHDFMAIFMAHAMTYYYLRGFDEERNDLVAAGCACATLGLLVKPPYVFYFFLPLAGHFLSAGRIARVLRLLPVFALPAIPFLAWRHYANSVNARQPDWYFLPGFFKYDDLSHWFYGPLEMRFDPANWLTIGERVVVEVLSPAGVVLFLLGLVLLRAKKGMLFFGLWICGALAAIVIFFNLNFVHNYYQNPLTAIAAVGIAAVFWRALPERAPASPARLAAVALGLAAFALSSVAVARYRYYAIDWPHHDAGRAVAEMTREDDLVVAISPVTLGAQDPRLLGRAHRYGWSVPESRVTSELLERLRHEGATAIAWLQTPSGSTPPADVAAYLCGAAVEVRDLPVGAGAAGESGAAETAVGRFLDEKLGPREQIPTMPEGGLRLYVYRLDQN